jgi:hypothetical protein
MVSIGVEAPGVEEAVVLHVVSVYVVLLEEDRAAVQVPDVPRDVVQLREGFAVVVRRPAQSE